MIAKEGLREILLATVVLGALSAAATWLFWPLAIPFVVIWAWVLSFFRDPPRRREYLSGELCARADGTITEIAELPDHPPIGGPAIRVGMFLSLFNVHINRSPCAGRVKSVAYRAGEFLDARHPESGSRNESNTLLIAPDAPLPGPIEVRQVAGLVARRIICHAKPDDHLVTGQRFGLIKFGSRTELIIPHCGDTEICVKLGDKVQAGLTIIARQRVAETISPPSDGNAAQAVRRQRPAQPTEA